MKTKTIYVTKKLKVPKPFVLPLQICLMLFFMSVFRFLGKTPSENESAIAIGGRLAVVSLHALCVFLCTLRDKPVSGVERTIKVVKTNFRHRGRAH